MNLKELKELIVIFEQAEVTELEIEREGVKIRLKKGKDKEAPTIALTPTPIETQPTPRQGQGMALPRQSQVTPQENLIKIEAPMVGVFYSAPSPEAPPFVEEGASVEKGEVLCIIEAMKLMNEIKSETKGKIKKILVENGHTVEYGQPLFLIEPPA